MKNKKKSYLDKCEQAFQQDGVKMLNKHWLDSNWKGFFPKDGKIDYKDRMTGVDLNVLEHIGTKYSSPPDCDFNLHPGSK